MNFVYITTNLVNEKQYVGSHNGEEDDSYLGSGRAILEAVKKYGNNNFKREILEECNPEENLILEEKYIKEYNTLIPNGYNISPTGGIGLNHYHSEEVKQKISKKQKGRKLSDESKKKMSKAKKGKPVPGAKGNIPWNKGKKGVSEKTSKKMSDAHKNRENYYWKGKTLPEEIKQKIRESKTGKKHSKETKEKMRISQQRRREQEKNN